jgi:hypothetical protein
MPTPDYTAKCLSPILPVADMNGSVFGRRAICPVARFNPSWYTHAMSLAEIRVEIAKLTDLERAQLIRELEEAEAAAWDRQIGEDFDAGKLDALIAEADADAKAGRVRELP